MSHKSVKLSPDTVFFHTPEGPVPVHPLVEAPDIEAEETEWQKEHPYIKPDAPATFTAGVKLNQDATKAITDLGEAITDLGEALGKAVQAVQDAANCIAAWFRCVDLAQLLKTVEEQQALKEAPPKVRQLALHGKKRRTRKKNINRALREYQKKNTRKGAKQ